MLYIYVLTAPRGLSWDLGGTDGGDLAAGVLTGGLAHPPGYPTYLLLAQIPILLPLGLPSFRLNLFSAVCTALTVALVVWAVNNYVLSTKENPKNGLAGAAAGSMLGLFPIVWSQAVITEVYALAGLFCAILLILAYWVDRAPAKHFRSRLAILTGVAGVGFGAHYIVGAMLVFVLIYLILRMPGRLLCLQNLGALASFGLGLLVFAYLPIRAGRSAISDWGRPDSLSRFIWVISAAAYSGRWHIELVLTRLPSLVRVLVGELSIPGTVLAVLGLSIWWDNQRRLTVAVLVTVFANAIMVAGYDSADTLPYLYPLFILLAIAAGAAGVEIITKWLPAWAQETWAFWLATAILLLTIWIPLLAVGIPQITAANANAEGYGHSIVEQAPSHSLIISNDDKHTFAIRYAVASLPERSDVIPVDVRLLEFEWFRQDLVQFHPGLKLNEQVMTEAKQFGLIDLLDKLSPDVPVIFTYQPSMPPGYTVRANEDGLTFVLVCRPPVSQVVP